VWAVFITAILLLLSLPVLAGSPKIFCPLKIWPYAGTTAIIWWPISSQSAGNLEDKPLGILRDYTPELTSLGHTAAIDGSYLAGLIEGDGYIGVPKTKGMRTEKGQLLYPSIQIAFCAKDLPLATSILACIGKGSLLKKKNTHSHILSFNSKDSQLKIIELIHGKLRTPKNLGLNSLIKYYEEDCTLGVSPIDKSPILSNNWLAGFIDADGHFSIRFSPSKIPGKKPRIACRFELVQREIDKSGISMYSIMNKIGEALKSKVEYVDRKEKGWPKSTAQGVKLRVRTSSLETNYILIEYLTTFCLKSSKKLDMESWAIVVDLIKDKKHLTKEGALIIQNIKNSINSNRVVFNWEHLIDISE
jgi:hypothetical protein